MECIEISNNQKEAYNAVVTHPLQSYEWGEFRKKTNVPVIRRGFVKNGNIVSGFTLTLHSIPKTKFTIGYLPKGILPTTEIIDELLKIGKEHNCIFIQLEPNIIQQKNEEVRFENLMPSFHPLFTKYTFVLDLRKSEEELLKSFHPKTRYNIRVAEKHGVKVSETNTDAAFKEYLRLTKETTIRQKFFAHTPLYHTKMWETLNSQNEKGLSARLLTATYQHETLVSWIVFSFHNYLYYPYGASSSKFRNVMASNLMMWKAIQFGKSLGLEYFDMWGALGPNPNTNDPWYGFHKFKEGYGATLTEFVGSYDLIINKPMYQFYKVADRLRWAYLKIKK